MVCLFNRFYFFFLTANSDEMIDKLPKSVKDETLSQLTAKRKVYVKRVSSKILGQCLQLRQFNKNNCNHLFECCLLVGLTLGESKHYVPYIKSIFPSHVSILYSILLSFF